MLITALSIIWVWLLAHQENGTSWWLSFAFLGSQVRLGNL